MHVFYIPDIPGKNYTLNDEESRHCIKTLRLKYGNEILLVDGKGTLYKAIIISDNPKSCLTEISKKIKNYEQRAYYIHLAIAPTKNSDRFEWLVEKAVEIGIDEITPLVCERSERKNINIQRLERIAIAAMKQSVKAYKPKINPCISFNNFIKISNIQVKLIAYCVDETENLHIQNPDILLNRKMINEVYKKGQSVLCLIGPEGDFSQSEILNAKTQGFLGVTLGNSRLRIETAGLIACHTIYYLNSI